MKQPDQLQRFIFEGSPIRGQHVSLDASWQQIVTQSDAEGPALVLLAEALAAVTLLVETLKIDGSIILQIRGDGPVHLLVAEATSRHTLRGVVRQTRPLKDEKQLRELFHSDKLVITIKPDNGKQHQGIVALEGENLASALQTYFDQSEQLPTRFWFASNQQTVSGLLLQKMPGLESDQDAWNRMLHLASTTRTEELLQLSAQDLLRRLFHEEDVLLFESQPLGFRCSCSRQRTRDMLISMGKPEIDDIIETQNELSITCEFCNAVYFFDRVDLEQLFSDAEFVSLSPTQH